MARIIRHRMLDKLREAAALLLFYFGLFAVTVVLAAVLGGCVGVVGPAVSAAGGWYTHDRINYIEAERVNGLEARVQKLEAAR